jgi:hypothetical protein
MQIFLGAFILIQICEIFSVGGIPYDETVRKVRGNPPSEHLSHAVALKIISRDFLRLISA